MTKKKLLWFTIAITGLYLGQCQHRKWREDEYRKCRAWADTQKGFWLTDPCASLLE